MSKQQEALQLADLFDVSDFALHRAAAAELRRLHEVNQELLEALKDILHFNGSKTPKEVIDKGEAAIAKATGESNE